VCYTSNKVFIWVDMFEIITYFTVCIWFMIFDKKYTFCKLYVTVCLFMITLFIWVLLMYFPCGAHAIWRLVHIENVKIVVPLRLDIVLKQLHRSACKTHSSVRRALYITCGVYIHLHDKTEHRLNPMWCWNDQIRLYIYTIPLL